MLMWMCHKYLHGVWMGHKYLHGRGWATSICMGVDDPQVFTWAGWATSICMGMDEP